MGLSVCLMRTVAGDQLLAMKSPPTDLYNLYRDDILKFRPDKQVSLIFLARIKIFLEKYSSVR
jgi:hypothetical protein